MYLRWYVFFIFSIVFIQSKEEAKIWNASILQRGKKQSQQSYENSIILFDISMDVFCVVWQIALALTPHTHNTYFRATLFRRDGYGAHHSFSPCLIASFLCYFHCSGVPIKLLRVNFSTHMCICFCCCFLLCKIHMNTVNVKQINFLKYR